MGSLFPGSGNGTYLAQKEYMVRQNQNICDGCILAMHIWFRNIGQTQMIRENMKIAETIFDNSEYISDMQNPVLKIDLDYFNSISLKNITRTIKDLLSANKDGFTVNWYYDADDEISHEEGVQMSEILGKKFNFIAKK